jgi:hypothetical protein
MRPWIIYQDSIVIFADVEDVAVDIHVLDEAEPINFLGAVRVLTAPVLGLGGSDLVGRRARSGRGNRRSVRPTDGDGVVASVPYNRGQNLTGRRWRR